MLVGDLEALEGGSNIIVGDSLAYELNVAIGDSVNLLNIDQSNPLIGVPRVIAFKVVGIFSVGEYKKENGGPGRTRTCNNTVMSRGF